MKKGKNKGKNKGKIKEKIKDETKGKINEKINKNKCEFPPIPFEEIKFWGKFLIWDAFLYTRRVGKKRKNKTA